MGLTDEQKKLLQSNVSILKDHGKEIMTVFYNTMFKEHPEFRNYFNQTNQKTGKQPLALSQTFYHAIQHLDNMDTLMPQMQRISNKHRALMVKPEHYPTVGKYLIQAIREHLGSRATPELMEAWQAAYNAVVSVFIKLEKEMYSQLGDNESEKGFLPYTIVKEELVASGPIVALTLVRQDGEKVSNYRPGQYISIRMAHDGVLHHGHYSLVEPYNGKSYTVAFKKGDHIDQNSIVSNEILKHRAVGSTVLVSPPAGTFGLVEGANNHLFISGGIGIAPLVAMIQELHNQGKSNNVTLIQCVRTDDAAAYSNKLRKILPQDRYLVFTQDHILSKEDLEGKLRPDTHVYVCGSDLFLNIAENALASFAHPKSQVRIESIEPTLRLLRNL